jgi:gluconokinase
MILIVMGVTGAGKTTVGMLLAEKLGWKFYDADDFHPENNIEKMKQGLSLTDDDRRPWLEALRRLIGEQPGPAVIACSALKQSYREYLSGGNKEVTFVYLKGSDELLRRRLLGREGHFADARILSDQLQSLEEPENVLTERADRDPETIAEDIIDKLNLR